jgi:hypothetical protein
MKKKKILLFFYEPPPEDLYARQPLPGNASLCQLPLPPPLARQVSLPFTGRINPNQPHRVKKRTKSRPKPAKKFISNIP